MVQCYYKNDANPSLIRSINSGVCMGSGSSAGFFSCCFPWDECLPSGFCHSNSTYYTALCTDQTLQDEVCQHGCGGLYRTGLQYDSESASWMCCDKSDTTCTTGTNATFDAPAPEQLLAQTRTIVDFIPTSTASSKVASSTGSTSSTGTSSEATAHSTTSPAIATTTANPSGMTTGAKAGIGAGIAVVLLVLVACVVIWLKRRKRHTKGSALNPPAWTLAGEMHASSVTPTLIHEKYTPVSTVEADSVASGPAATRANQRYYEMD